MTGEDLKNKFRLLNDEQDDLSEQEILDLANTCYREILNDRPWSFLIKTETGTLNTSDTEYTLPTDFRMLENNFVDLTAGQPWKKVLYVGDDYETYDFITFAQKRQYRNQSGYAYIDYRQNKLVLTKTPSESKSYEFDYIYKPDDITASTEPVIPAEYHIMIAHLMVYKWADIDQTDRNFSYAKENLQKYQEWLTKLRLEDAQKKQLTQ